MRTYKIKDISEKIFSGGTPSTKVISYWNGYHPWLSSGETQNEYIYSTLKTISVSGIKNSSTKMAKHDSVIIASAGQGKTRGQVSYLKIDSYINQSIIAIQSDLHFVLPKYLFYNLKNRYNEIRLFSDSTSTRGSITTKMVGELSIDLPNLEHQQHIVDILRII